MAMYGNLCCEGVVEPVGVGTETPVLSWEINSEVRNLQCRAWHIKVEDESGAYVWDSGVTENTECRVCYSGAPLKSRGLYRWQVRNFMSDGASAEWSQYASFECGFFNIADWPGSWTQYDCNLTQKKKLSVIHMRGEFSIGRAGKVKRARAFVAATGPHPLFANDALRMNLYEFHFNGRKVGDDLVNPGQLSQKRGRALFRVFDITGLVRERNAAGLIYAADKVSVQIFIDFEDGTTYHNSCGQDWRWTRNPGPFVRLWKHDIKEYGGRGEFYDARNEMQGWDMPDYDVSAWNKVLTYTPPDILAPQTFGVHIDEILKPQSLKQLSNGLHVADFGRIFNGFIRIAVHGKAGNKITLRFAEKLKGNGNIDVRSTSGTPGFDQYDVYIKKSDKPELYVPSFATHSFRYVSIECAGETVTESDIQGIIVTAAIPNRSSFHSSDERLMRLHELCINTFKSNMVSIPTDCPGRERNGWTADAYLVTDAEMLNFDAIHMFRKWYDDACDMQESDGYISYICPFPFSAYGKDIVWSACVTLSLWDAYRNNGDTRMLRHYYRTVTRLGECLAAYADTQKNIADDIRYGGDHVAPVRPAVEFMGYAYCFRNLDILSRICRDLGENQDAVHFEQKAAEFKAILNSRFINEHGLYDNNSQSANAHALHFGFVDDTRRAAIIAELVAGIEKEPAFTAGMLGYYSLMNGLSENGRDDIIWRLVASDEPGAWGSWLRDFNATTASEIWFPAQNQSCSWNHPMLVGGLSSWLYRALGGIRPQEPGYARIAFNPFFPPEINDVSVSIDTPRGLVRSAWKRNGNEIELEVIVPVNTSAEIYIPGENGRIDVVAKGSGTYKFNFKHALWKRISFD